ncbi:MAG: HEAT repeat domain-containing protein [Oscillatoriales cyanobacterium RM1_1_9]|nr:HEAT repeat domain-containing protein [Oscillatoriales cyanobacterium SM2_3_0]NJO44580.1 HEAT repeat domain-containing protein [Oscillatoriales cyanobacterium RM2_1_1]NJO70730.1 HEAT repeat domain-containing protein [Oscillatoriales cyanobacterium RM1_1_9]
MEIAQIKHYLQSHDSQERLRALVALRDYDSPTAVPLLLSRAQDSEFLVRSFVAMGLGNKQSPEAFDALVNLLTTDPDHNVRAEAANSLSKYGAAAVDHLVQVFQQDQSWLVRRSILAPLMDMPHPEALYQICLQGLAGDDQIVREESISALGALAHSSQQAPALEQLLALVSDPAWQVRARVARALAKFDQAQAQAAVSYLRRDQDHRVVGAALEGSLETS